MAAEEAVRAFFRAVRKGAVEEVRAMLDEDGRLLEAWSPSGLTPLIFSAIFGHADVVRLLLGRGADIEATDDDIGVTALYFAVGATKEGIVSVLLGHGANASMVGPSGCTPLIAASRCGSSNIVKRLLRSLGGQGVNAQAVSGGTAFAMASREGHVEIARMLLLEGADHTIADNDGNTARMKAEAKGHAECVALIQWWEVELERAYAVHKARRGLEVPATWQAPGAPVPAYLMARAQGNKPVPEVQLRGLGGSGEQVTQRAATGLQEQVGEGPCEGEKQATLQYVTHDLAPDLYTELMAGFHQKGHRVRGGI